MIIYFLGIVITTILASVSSIFSNGSQFTLATIPYLGQGFSDTLYSMVGYWNTFLQTIPYLELPWFIFIRFIIYFELALLFAKLFLGQRNPVSDN